MNPSPMFTGVKSARKLENESGGGQTHRQADISDGRTDRLTEGRTNGRTDREVHREGCVAEHVSYSLEASVPVSLLNRSGRVLLSQQTGLIIGLDVYEAPALNSLPSALALSIINRSEQEVLRSFWKRSETQMKGSGYKTKTTFPKKLLSPNYFLCNSSLHIGRGIKQRVYVLSVSTTYIPVVEFFHSIRPTLRTCVPPRKHSSAWCIHLFKTIYQPHFYPKHNPTIHSEWLIHLP